MNEIHSRAFVLDPVTGAWRLRPERLYGRCKMTALLARHKVPASYERVHKAMQALGHDGLRRTKKVRTTVADPGADRAPDLRKRGFTAPTPEPGGGHRLSPKHFVQVGAPLRSHVVGVLYVAFIVDV